MDTWKQIIIKTAQNTSPEESTLQFIHDAFINVLIHEEKSPDEYQARAAITGRVFELCLEYIFETCYPNLRIERNVDLPEALMTGTGGADFVIYNQFGKKQAVIEAKGSVDELQWPDGTVIENSRPGLLRSDTVKKSICQAYQIDKAYTAVPFVIISSHIPESGSGADLLTMAE